MARRSFEQSVNRIRQLDASEGQVAFEMGDEVLEQAPIGAGHANTGGLEILQRLAVETGVDFEVLRQRRFVSSRVPHGTRVPSVAWAIYREIAYVEDVIERERLLKLVATEDATQLVDGVWRPTRHKTADGRPRWTVDAIRTHKGEKSANPALGSEALLDRAFKGTPPQVILHRAFQEATPEAIDDVLDQPEVRRAVYEGLHRRELEASERRERHIAADPIGRRLDQQEAMLDLQKWVDVMRRHIERLHDDILPRLGKAPDRDPMAMRRFLAEALADLDEATAPVRTFVETGGTDVDRFLSEVLGGNRG